MKLYKPDKRLYKKRKLKTIIFEEHRLKSSQQNIDILNLVMYKKNN